MYAWDFLSREKPRRVVSALSLSESVSARARARVCVNADDVTAVWVIWRLAASEGFTESSLAYIRQLNLSLCWNEVVGNEQRAGTSAHPSLRFETRHIYKIISRYEEREPERADRPLNALRLSVKRMWWCVFTVFLPCSLWIHAPLREFDGVCVKDKQTRFLRVLLQRWWCLTVWMCYRDTCWSFTLPVRRHVC